MCDLKNPVPVAADSETGTVFVGVDGLIETMISDMDNIPADAVVEKHNVIEALRAYQKQVHKAYQEQASAVADVDRDYLDEPY